MPLNRLTVREFSAFRSADLTFADGINVFIGTNGTGKTHLMKLMYAMLEAARGRVGGSPHDKLVGVFRPDDGQAKRLVRRLQGANTADVSLSHSNGGRFRFQLPSKRGDLRASLRGWAEKAPAVFLPSREILALYEGFIHAYQFRELSFDETYFDACVALNANPIRGVRRQMANEIVASLREALGGRVELAGSRFYVKFKGDPARMEAHLVAEGLRKIASLERLVLNGSLTRNGFLFWDEPEANLNPKLTSVVVEILRALASQGIQIFLTTHDYLLARRLSVSTGIKRWPKTQFFVCHRAAAAAPVEVAQADTLDGLPMNPIADEFMRLYEFEREATNGSANK